MTDQSTLRASTRPISGHGVRATDVVLAELAGWCREHDVSFDE